MYKSFYIIKKNGYNLYIYKNLVFLFNILNSKFQDMYINILKITLFLKTTFVVF